MIEIKDLSYSRGGKTLFQSATINIYPGNKIGLIGANGAGKSSFFSLLLKNDLPDSGDIFIPEKYVVSHVEQEISNLKEKIISYVLQGHSQLYTVLQTIQDQENNGTDQIKLPDLYAKLEDLGGYEAKHKAEKLLTGLGFNPAQFEDQISSLSGGWQMRLNLARALMSPSDLLLLDEPTNHLDLDTIIWLEDYLKAYEGTLLLISHDREFLDSVCQKIAAISQQQITLYNGNYSSYELQFAARQEQQIAQAKKTDQKINELNQFITRFKAKASKAKQAQSRVKALNKLEKIAPFYANKSIQFSFYEPDKLPNNLLSLENISFSYDDRLILSELSFTLFANSRIGILGVNGAGKSTLVKLLAQQNKPDSGLIQFHNDIRIAYFAQDFLEQLDTKQPPLNLYKSRFSNLSDQEIRNHLGQFGFSNDMALQEIQYMSGGEKARLALSILVLQKPNLLILDEPTNHLDLDVRESLTMALQSYEGSLLLVSHDRHLLESVCDEFYLMNNKHLLPFDGNLDDYRRFSQEKNKVSTISTTSSKAPVNKKSARKEAAELREKLKPLTKKINNIEKELDNLNSQLSALEETLSSPAIYEDKNKSLLRDTLQEQSSCKSRIEELEEQWLSLTEQLEEAKNQQ